MSRSNDYRNFTLQKLVITPPPERNANPIDLGADGTSITDFYYQESILNDTIRCSVTYSDIGRYLTPDGKRKTILEGMPLEGGEDVDIVFKDLNHNVTISIKMQVKSINQTLKDVTKTLVTLDLVSEEAIRNYKTVVTKKYDGLISDHVQSILKDPNILNTKKSVEIGKDIEKTSNTYNFIGNNLRPFYVIHSLCNYSIPDIPGAKGNTAGFLFFETSDGFKFKSIDGMLSEKDPSGNQKVIRSFIYNQTPYTPEGYDSRILEILPPNPSGDVLKKLEAGTYSTRTILFDPFNCYYEVIVPNTQAPDTYYGSEKNLSKAGKNLPKINPKFNNNQLNKDFSKTKYYILDTGTLPSGTVNQQIEKSKEQNFDPKNILNQFSMRYNQLFSSKTEITIFGDFRIHAGDLIRIDIPDQSEEEIDKQFGGNYLVADLCHYYSTSHGCYTKIYACRDSVGRTINSNSKLL